MNLGFTLAPGETVIRRVNRHWIALAPVIAATVVIVILITAMTYLFGRYRSSLPGTITDASLVVIVVVLLILALLILYAGLWIYRRNFIVLTNQHLVRIEQKGLFARSVSQLSLDKVQDVSGTVSGFLATMFRFGDITVETAGAEDNFIFNTVSDPSAVAAECLKAHEEFEARGEVRPAPPSATAATTMAIPTPTSVPAPPPGMVEEVIYVPKPVPMEESVTETIEHPE